MRPHHASSSCKDEPEICDWDTYDDPGPNYHTLYGPLVGGPRDVNSDTIADDRNDYFENEVTLDYNAGFQSTLAGLLQK
jgi:endoglucanase